MNAVTQPGAEVFLARQAGLRDRLPGARLPWMEALREDAAASFRAQGLPSRRVEAWRYTDLTAVGQAGFAEALTVVAERPVLPPAQAPRRAVFVDGRFDAGLSTGAFRNVAGEIAGLAGRLGNVAPHDALPLVALNAMLFEDGLVLDLAEEEEAGTVELLLLCTHAERPIGFHPRHLIRLGVGSRLTLIEGASGPEGARYLHNPVFEIEVGERASFTHVRMQREGRAGFHLSTVFARVQAGGTYDKFTLNAGAKLVRHEIHASLLGPRAACHMNGAQLVADGQHADTTTFLDHVAPDCASRQTYKTVLTGRSRGVFQGKIHVHQAAQRTDGYQMNQALLLSEDAEMDAKPQLEIYADDVKCSHGATVGALDANQLFFLRSRGIPFAQARAMLVQAFLAEAVSGVADEACRDMLREAVEDWWQREVA